jgi:hypothetical protein
MTSSLPAASDNATMARRAEPAGSAAARRGTSTAVGLRVQLSATVFSTASASPSGAVVTSPASSPAGSPLASAVPTETPQQPAESPGSAPESSATVVASGESPALVKRWAGAVPIALPRVRCSGLQDDLGAWLDVFAGVTNSQRPYSAAAATQVSFFSLLTFHGAFFRKKMR